MSDRAAQIEALCVNVTRRYDVLCCGCGKEIAWSDGHYGSPGTAASRAYASGARHYEGDDNHDSGTYCDDCLKKIKEENNEWGAREDAS